ncbi:hypothetical protein Tco_0702597 [Tanacetum coccineum]|uniref:RPA43 OB domain-containing protein n=1 Tax=Tanacetum coccineum TaxID=301880 RepID=A0ABQ4XXA9_9ASTR
MAQQVIPAAQLVPRFHTIRRCNNYTVLQSIPSSHECKIVGQILLDHPLSYALTATADVPVVIEEDYHSIKDDIPLVSVYTTGNVLVREMLILGSFLTEEIRATNDFKEYEMMFVNVDALMNQPQPVVSTQGTHRSTPRAHGIPTLTANKTALAAKAQENVAKVQEKLYENEIEKMVEGEKGEEDEESYASAFVNSVFNDDFDDSGTKIEPESHKEHPEHVTDDEKEIKKEKKDEEVEKENKDEEIEKEKEDIEIVREKDIADDGIVSEELTATISPITATTSKDSSTTKRKKRSFSHKTQILPGSIAGMCQ